MIITESGAVLHRWPVHQPAMSKAAQKRRRRKLKKEIGWTEFQLASQAYTGTEGQHTTCLCFAIIYQLASKLYLTLRIVFGANASMSQRKRLILTSGALSGQAMANFFSERPIVSRC